MIVCIAEKPSVAKDIAKVLGANQTHDGYMEGNGYQVTWTFGHLCTLKAPDEYTPEWKRWDMKYLPMVPPRFGISLIDDEVFKFENMNVEIDISHTDQAGKTICKKTGKLNTLVATEVNIEKYWNVVMTYLERCR